MRFLARSAVLAAAIAATLALAGCQDILNSLLDTGAPTGLSASDGDYSDSISVSWSAPDLSSEKWKGYSVDHYYVSWDSGYYWTTSTSCTILSVTPAVSYTVTVEAVLDPLGGGSASDTGFAMDADDLKWYDGGRSYDVSSGDQWYVTMLQRGFSYRFAFADSAAGSVEFYPFKTLESVAGPISGTSPTWICDKDGTWNKFYVKVRANAASSFTAQCDYGYGF
jgi:hypothetical protein